MMLHSPEARAYAAEALGTAFLLAVLAMLVNLLLGG